MKRFLLLAAIAVLAFVAISCPNNGGSGVPDLGGGDLIVPPPVNGGGGSGTRTFVITSPYEGVDWDAWGRYKASLHTHTINSDGAATMEAMLDRHFLLGFDILAVTDHVWRRVGGNLCFDNLLTRCVTDTGWPAHAQWQGDGDTVPLSHITAARLQELQTGVGRGGRPMLIIPGAAELAPGSGSPNDEMAEANVFFWMTEEMPPSAWTAPYNTVRMGIQAAHRNNALSFINHPGRTTGAAAYDVGAIHSPTNPSNMDRWVNHYTAIYMEFPMSSLVGLEIFNRRDGDSRHDRVLWDNINTRTIPHGRFVWGFANDDTHSNSNTSASSIGTNVNVFLMPENNLDNIKATMRSGAFYMRTHVARNEGVIVEGAHPRWHYGTGCTLPRILSIEVDEDEYTITIVAENADRIVWISNGITIQTIPGGAGSSTVEGDRVTSTLELAHAHIGFQVGVYVRANIFAPGNQGIALTQPIGTRRN